MNSFIMHLVDEFESEGVLNDNLTSDEKRMAYFLVESYENQRLLDPSGYYYMLSRVVKFDSDISDEDSEKAFQEMKKALEEDMLKYPSLERKNLDSFVYRDKDIQCFIIRSKNILESSNYFIEVNAGSIIKMSLVKSDLLSLVNEGQDVFFKLKVLIKGLYGNFNPNEILFNEELLTLEIETKQDGTESIDNLDLHIQNVLKIDFIKDQTDQKEYKILDILTLSNSELSKFNAINIMKNENNQIIAKVTF